MGVKNVNNQIGLVQDKQIFSKIDFGQIATPSFKKTTKDKYHLKQTMFVQIYDKSGDNDITVVPFELDVNFTAAIKPGPHYHYGPT